MNQASLKACEGSLSAGWCHPLRGHGQSRGEGDNLHLMSFSSNTGICLCWMQIWAERAHDEPSCRHRGVVWLQTSEQQRPGDENVPRWYGQLGKRVLRADLEEFVLVCAVVTKLLSPAFHTPAISCWVCWKNITMLTWLSEAWIQVTERSSDWPNTVQEICAVWGNECMISRTSIPASS